MAEYTPVATPATTYTIPASAAVTGGRNVAVSGNNTVAPAGVAAPNVVGVAAFDALLGADVTIWMRGTVHEVTASGAITAGGRVDAAANGTVAAAAAGPNNVGVALTTAADGALVRYMAL